MDPAREQTCAIPGVASTGVPGPSVVASCIWPDAQHHLVAQGAIGAPIVIGCDGPGGGTAKASPRDPTVAPPATIEGLLAALNARVRAASWVTVEDRSPGDVIGSVIPMFAIVADGTPEMARRIARALGCD